MTISEASYYCLSQRLKRLPAVQETWVRSLSREDHLEKVMATHSSILAWRLPWREEPGRLESMGLQRVGHDWATSLHFKMELDSRSAPLYGRHWGCPKWVRWIKELFHSWSPDCHWLMERWIKWWRTKPMGTWVLPQGAVFLKTILVCLLLLRL